MDKHTLTTALKNDVITLTFVKKNGLTRTMTCTINRDFLRANDEVLGYVEPSSTKDMSGTDYVIVWDIENEGWRTVNSSTTEILKVTSFEDYMKDVK